MKLKLWPAMNEYWLIPIALVTSSISGATGLGGGVILIGIMSSFFNPASLIPIHGAVQLTSNLSRCVFSMSDLRKDIVYQYMLGASIGAIIGSRVVLAIPERFLWLALGTFLLVVTWLPLKKILSAIRWKYSVIGGVSTFLALFVGITGPLLHPIIMREELNKHEFIGTEAACAGFTHFLKIIVFSVLGFSLLSHWKLVAPMIGASVIGSYIGKQILDKIPQKIFYWVIHGLITILAARMLLKYYESLDCL